VAAPASLLIVVLITRELGGGRSAQTLCAWGYISGLPLLFGHVFLTASLDLVFWPLIVLFVVRAVLREEPRWWLWAGVVVGVSTYNKLLVSLLVISLVVGVLLVGPRRLLLSRPVGSAALIALIICAPLIACQATHSWPQVTMGRALSDHNAGDTRTQMWPLMLVFLGPPQVPMWTAGFVALLRRPQWRAVRFVGAPSRSWSCSPSSAAARCTTRSAYWRSCSPPAASRRSTH
jgi:Dolichyl-phosphate-mannose-protein mannosyltransferase